MTEPLAKNAGQDAASCFRAPQDDRFGTHRLKSRLRPMRGLRQFRSVRVISVGHAFIQNVRRGHSELATDIDPRQRLATAFAELALAN